MLGAAAGNYDAHLDATGDKVPAEGARGDAEPATWPDAQELGGDDADTHGARPPVRQRPAPAELAPSGHGQSPPRRCRRDPCRL